MYDLSEDCTAASTASIRLIGGPIGTPTVPKTDHLGIVLAQSKLRIGGQELVEVHQVVHEGQLLPRCLVLRSNLYCLLKLVSGAFVLSG